MAQLPRQEKAPMKRMLDAKIALVAGRNSGIGWASAILFAQEGAKVAITGRNAAEGEAAVAEIVAGGGEAIFIQSDLTLAGAPSAAIAHVVSTWGRLDCAFNNRRNQRQRTVVERR
jgi:NAD(P)-dependent dehydrogenase (short-subunit alcohol dehydrogenase family)